jgi:hypothetical protein
MASLRLTPDMCEGKSGTMLMAVLKEIAPPHVKLTLLSMVRNEKDPSLELLIYWRHKGGNDRWSHSDSHFADDHVLRFKVDYWNPELPAEVILAKLALI